MHALRFRLAAALALVASSPACAKRTDEAMRRAWEDSAGQGGARGPDVSSDPSGAQGTSSNGPIAFGWARVDEVLGWAVDILAIGPDEVTMTRLAERWCAIEPQPQSTIFGPVFVCHPDPPVAIDGHTLVLELGSPGVIGLVARDLTEAQSQAFTERARSAATRLCTSPWQEAPPVTARDGSLREEFQTCAALGGPIVAVGRYRVEEQEGEGKQEKRGSDVWHVSVAVLGTT